MLKLLNVIDEYSREALAIDIERSIDADGVVACLERLAAERGAPAYVRFDHGPEFIAYAVADWCRFNGTDTVFIDPGSPWQNAWIESIQRPPTRRVLERTALRFSARSQGPPRGLADRLQHEQATQRARLAHPGRVRRGMAQQTTAHTRIAGGSTIGIPSHRALAGDTVRAFGQSRPGPPHKVGRLKALVFGPKVWYDQRVSRLWEEAL